MPRKPTAYVRRTTRKTKTGAELRKNELEQLRNREVAEVLPTDLLSASQDKLCTALSYLDAHQLSTASPRDLVTVIKQLFDITQVLQGKPTTIHSSTNRKALKDLIPAVLKEAQRRGLSVDVPRGTAGDGAKVIEGEVLSAEPLSGEGTRHTPPGHSESGPIAAQEQSDFSKILDDF